MDIDLDTEQIFSIALQKVKAFNLLPQSTKETILTIDIAQFFLYSVVTVTMLLSEDPEYQLQSPTLSRLP
jgi:hypothetical protein